MKLVLSLFIIIIYWCLDSYQAVLNFDISFTKAFFLDYENSNLLIRFLIVFIFLMFFWIQNKTKPPVVESKKIDIDEELKAIYAISDTILTPIPLHKQLNTVVDIMEQNLKIKTAFIASFENDKILLINTNSSLSKIGIKTEYKPYYDELRKKSIDKLLSISYLEKREYMDDFIEINGITYRAILRVCKDIHLKIPICMTVMILEVNDTNDYQNFLTRCCELVAFTINLTKKKDEVIKAQSVYNAQFSSVDTQFNIPTNLKLQKTIEHEIKRSQRYGTSLSLMIIEIDHLKNISTIFSDKESLAIKKEIVSLLKKNIRETDMFGKWSDNHFAIIAPDVDFRATKSFANKLNRNLAEHRFTKVGKITCSYGITSFSPKDSIGSFRKRAENALSEATKRDGNSIEIKILV